MQDKVKLKGYVAGKLNDDAVGYIKNMHNMIKTARELRKLGFAVYVPCNDILEGLVDGNFGYADYFDNSQPWLLSSNFVFLCEGWQASTGTKRETVLAQENNIPVFEQINQLKEYYGIRN
jgi:hypothetical protein